LEHLGFNLDTTTMELEYQKPSSGTWENPWSRFSIRFITDSCYRMFITLSGPWVSDVYL
jgi:hypothetical protein